MYATAKSIKFIEIHISIKTIAQQLNLQLFYIC